MAQFNLNDVRDYVVLKFFLESLLLREIMRWPLGIKTNKLSGFMSGYKITLLIKQLTRVDNMHCKWKINNLLIR